MKIVFDFFKTKLHINCKQNYKPKNRKYGIIYGKTNHRQGRKNMKNIYIVSHTHWDREWYMPFEKHRARLVKLIDKCMELIENDSDFVCFNLDGHTALIEDYLEIKPQNREKIKRYISDGRLTVGPWYVLQDEFLTSSESNVRNLLVGMALAREFGRVSMVGYFPDSFGNAGQMPQILAQAGMKAIYFGRGVKPTGAANIVSDFADYDSKFSEMYWRSPDGSKLPAILFANWYNNGAEIPADGNCEWWDEKIKDVEKYAATDELLMMNGCDHQPVQSDISQAIRAAAENYPEYGFKHSSLEGYADAVIKALPKDVSVICGELTSQDTDGWGTLVGTASSHSRLKVMNRKCEILLESVAEPLSVMAYLAGMTPQREMLLYSWKTLMKNHPHDSICGCSVDEVNDEMRTRFIKSRQSAQTVVDDCLECLAEHININGLEHCKAAFAVVNTFSKIKSGIVTVNIDIERNYDANRLMQTAREINAREKKRYALVDSDGNRIPCTIRHNRARFGYDLPDDKFRQPYMAENITVTFNAENIPPLGYKAYGIIEGAAEEKIKTMITAENTMENEYVKAKINGDGMVNLTDKTNGREYRNILRYEDVGDIGNEYMFMPAAGDNPIYSGDKTEIRLVTDEEYMAEYEITSVMSVPKSADADLQNQIFDYVEYKQRRAKRAEKTVELRIVTRVALEKGSRSLNVKTEVDNTAKDHRLRVLIPTGLKCENHKAGSVFETAERNNRRKKNWTYPCGTDRQQMFVLMNEPKCGIAVANIGMYEYEILSDNTIAVTLVRATGDLGDWGVFPTKLSQCLGKTEFEYCIIPFTDEEEAYDGAFKLQYPLQSVQIFGLPKADIPNQGLSWSGDMLYMTACKPSQSGNDVIMRWVSYSAKPQTLTVYRSGISDNLYVSNIMEEKFDRIEEKDGKWEIRVDPYKIITLGISKRIGDFS